MKECRYKKRLQIYVDGWMEEHESRRFEEHLKGCPECQTEMAELEEVGGAALEIVDQAPEPEYWESFYIRVRNRILSRNVRPILEEEKTPRLFPFRLVFVSAAVLVLAVAMLFLLRPVPKAPSTAVTEKSSEVRQLPADGTVARPAAPALISKSTAATTAIDLAGNGSRKSPTSATVGTTANAPAREQAPAAPRAIVDEVAPLTLAELREKDLRAEFREQVLIGKAELKLEDDYQSAVQLLASTPSLIDPVFRMRSSVLTEKLLSGLGRDNQGGIAAIYHGPIYGNHSASMTGKDQENGISSTWGYLRVASDTSRSNEIKKYLIELELMQVK